MTDRQKIKVYENIADMMTVVGLFVTVSVFIGMFIRF